MTLRLRDTLILVLLWSVVNGLVAWLVRQPGYVDAYYYFNSAQIMRYGGAVEPYFWNYLIAPDALPVALFSYWLPGASLLALPGLLIFPSAPFTGAQIIYILASASLPLLAFELGTTLGGRRTGWYASLLMVFSGIYAVYWSLPETFTPFAVSAGWALYLTGRLGSDSKWWAWLGVGLLTGFAALTRGDGVLVPVVIVLIMLYRMRGELLKKQVGMILPVLIGLLVLYLPWTIREMLLPGEGASALTSLWLVDYEDIFLYPNPVSFRYALDAGIGPNLLARWEAFKSNLMTVIGVQGLVFLIPLMMMGGWKLHDRREIQPSLIYGGLLFLALTLGFAQVGLRGAYLHSSAALAPALMACAAVGLEVTVRWAADHIEHWDADRSTPVFGGMMIAVAAAITLAMVGVKVIGAEGGGIAWNEADRVYGEVGAVLDAEGYAVDAPVMSNNAPGFYYHTGRAGIPVTTGDEAMLLDAVDHYGAQYLVLDQNVVGEMIDLYLNGPKSSRLELVSTFDAESETPVYLYRILPEGS